MKNASILIVDDDRTSVKTLRHHLGRLFSVVVATNGEQALLLAQGSSTPDLILLDVLMPGIDGFEVCVQLKANPRTAAIPIIFITGLSDSASEQKGLELGAVDFISKPCSGPRLRARVRNHLELKRHRDNLESLVHERTAELLLKQQQLTELNERLNRQHIELENHRDNLELLVDERTAELMSKQRQLSEMNEKLEEMVAVEVNKNREKDMLMVHQQKLASIGQLAAGVAHEINNPMSFIMSNLNSLSKYSAKQLQYNAAIEEALGDCPAEIRSRLADLHHSLDLHFIAEDIFALISESLEGAERIRKIVHDLKDFAGIDEDTMIETDLNHCVQSAISIARGKINAVADLELSLADIPPVLCNPQLINQVISNLLENAVHAITGRGKITVCTEYRQTWGMVTVTDTGRGIPSEIIGRIFDPFYTTKEVGKGTGLGLSVSYDIVKKHGGEITVTSEVGVGTRFIVKLPVSS